MSDQLDPTSPTAATAGTDGRRGDRQLDRREADAELGARTSPVYDPATGDAGRGSRWPSVDEVDDASRPRVGRGPRLAGRRRCRAGPSAVPVPPPARRAPAEIAAGRSRPSTARCRRDALGELARGLENVEFACGIPQLLKGGFSRAGRHRRRRALGAPAARGRRRASRRSTSRPWCRCGCYPNADRVRQHVRAEAEREGPVGVAAAGRAVRRGRAPRRRVQRRAGRRGRGRPAARAPRHRRGQLRRLHPDRAVTCTRPAPRTASGCRRSAAPRTTWSCCPTPTSRSPPTPRSARRTARPASGAWPSRSSSRSATSRDPLVDAIATRLPDAAHRARRRSRRRRWGRSSPASTATGRVATSTAAASEGADGRRRRPRGGVRRRRVLPRRLTRRPRAARTCASTTTRSSARCSRSCASTRYDEALGLVNDNPYGNGSAIFTRDGGAARQFEFDVDCGMVGVNVPIPVPVAYYSFGGWKCVAVRRHRDLRPRRHRLLHARPRSSRRAGPIPRRRPSTSASPGTSLKERSWTSASCCRPIRRRGGSSS